MGSLFIVDQLQIIAHSVLLNSFLPNCLNNLTTYVNMLLSTILPCKGNNYLSVYCNTTITLYRIAVADNNKTL